MDKTHCIFCHGKELAIALLTGRGYPIGEKCSNKVIANGGLWEDTTSITELRKLIRHRYKKLPDADS